MNTDLISRSALKEAVNDKKVVGRFNTIQLIDNAPPVKYTFEEAFQKTVCEHRLYCPERPQGKWIEEDGSYYANCSCCGYQIDTHYERGYLNFCPNCGADMRVKGEKQ